MIRYGRLAARRGSGVRLNRDEALGYLGYAGQRVDETLLARFHELADSCETVVEPVYAWGLFDVDGAESCWDGPQQVVSLRGCALQLPGESIAEHLRGARKVALMACTLGAVSEREMRKFAALSAADGVMYGACASALVEAAANAVEGQVVEAACELGLHTNWRFSPGYGDLPLDVQPAFLAALDATRKLGVTLTKTNMLVPVKSVTAVVGLFDEIAAGADARSACGVCQLKGCCELRKRGITCHG